MIALEIEAEDPRWDAVPDRDGLLQRAADAALAVLPQDTKTDLAATVLLADDEAVRELNRGWRGQDKPTNVLSFPSPDMPSAPGRPRHLGEIALAYETVAREAEAEGKTTADHAAHLVVHAVLHLFGHDHLEEGEAEAMERLEVQALARLGIADPYGPAA
ncbi:rRNA maturation RNase YbeY [Enterovirga rhinocerotis]|uniref:Endoribonuclease YbeY n=1 Tax=Enterovirga rhinocerotis TaxID=1339210 RepID=A0A4R7BNS7_9HYPH|nr:rRNA maturation RNase YbeY [Enterovirga rhinocerotis]TDR87158.1 putative rRNA maturation factor [Enterovirga rhinocerotis]